MRERTRWGLVLLALLAAVPQGRTQQPAAETTEVRDFMVQVGGKQVGYTQLAITQRPDGTTLVNSKSHVKVKIIINYTYSSQGAELWKDYQLLRMEGQCDDNAKKFSVSAQFDAQNNALRVQADNKEQTIKPDVWTTSYWRLPEAKFHNNAITLVDADRGEVIGGQLQYVGTEELPIAGQKQKCYRFKINGPNPPVDLWYDAFHRLVRQEFTERGHRVVLELVNVKR